MHKWSSIEEIYADYENSLKNLRKLIRKRQERNSELADKDRNIGEQYVFNKNMIDITLMNEMVRDTIYDMETMEKYMDYDDRKYLHRRAKQVSDDILSSYTLYGLMPDGEVEYSSEIDNVEDIITNVELQEEIVELMDEVLTERQRQVVNCYFWECKTQEEIAKELKLDRTTITKMIQNSLEKLRNSVNVRDLRQI